MKISDRPRRRYSAIVLSIFLLVGLLSLSSFAQNAETKQMSAKASELFEAMNYTEALPLLEKLAVLMPLDASVHRDFGFHLDRHGQNYQGPGRGETVSRAIESRFR
ncbi:MAG TPA: hypothetical protein VGQ55_10375 [Pyrinomonadaceae bacterium]|jgi:hypothetical protein|nr:hypothetical protein [Pyrinomonadaceae bacterium]